MAGRIWYCLLALMLVSTGGAVNFSQLEQQMVSRYGTQRVKLFRNWQGMLYQAQNLSKQEKVRRVNGFFNEQIFYQEDKNVWTKSDYWATPIEFMGKGRGDCEDYSIAKYYSLQILGIPVRQLRMVYVKIALNTPQGKKLLAHMVLAYYPTPNATPLILDNFNKGLLPASQRSDLYPIYNFNSEGVWRGTGRSAVKGKMSRWQNLLARARQEGFVF